MQDAHVKIFQMLFHYSDYEWSFACFAKKILFMTKTNEQSKVNVFKSNIFNTCSKFVP